MLKLFNYNNQLNVSLNSDLNLENMILASFANQNDTANLAIEKQENMILSSFANQNDTANLAIEEQENLFARWSNKLVVDFNSKGYVINCCFFLNMITLSPDMSYFGLEYSIFFALFMLVLKYERTYSVLFGEFIIWFNYFITRLYLFFYYNIMFFFYIYNIILMAFFYSNFLMMGHEYLNDALMFTQNIYSSFLDNYISTMNNVVSTTETDNNLSGSSGSSSSSGFSSSSGSSGFNSSNSVMPLHSADTTKTGQVDHLSTDTDNLELEYLLYLDFYCKKESKESWSTFLEYNREEKKVSVPVGYQDPFFSDVTGKKDCPKTPETIYIDIMPLSFVPDCKSPLLSPCPSLDSAMKFDHYRSLTNAPNTQESFSEFLQLREMTDTFFHERYWSPFSNTIFNHKHALMLSMVSNNSSYAECTSAILKPSNNIINAEDMTKLSLEEPVAVRRLLNRYELISGMAKNMYYLREEKHNVLQELNFVRYGISPQPKSGSRAL